MKLEDLMGKNYRMALWFKSVEKRNKKLKEYYDYGRYNIEIFSKQR